MKRLGRCLPFLATCVLAAAAGVAGEDPRWRAVGPTGGDVRALAPDPRDPRIVYLGTADGVLYKSEDGGVRWGRLNPGVPLRGKSLDNILVDLRGRVFVGYWEVAGDGGGVARSLDDGRTFAILPGVDGESVRALDESASSPDTLVAGAISGVFRSDDGGDSWRRISPKADAELRNVESVAIDPKSPDVTYVGTWHLPWKTVDGGRTWRGIHNGMIDDSDVFTMTLDRRDPRVVYATACTGIYRSGDAAARWSKAQGIPASSRRTRSFAQDPDEPNVLYAGTTEGLFISGDGSSTWRLATGKDVVVNAIAPLPREHGDAILLGTEGAGVLRSADGGRTWQPSNDGFAEQVFSRVLVEPATGRVVVGVVGDRRHGGVLQAPGPEGPWTRVGEGLEGREILSVALDQGEVLAGTDDGVFLSVSHCGTWRRLPTVVDGIDVHPHAVETVSLPGGVLCAATSDGLLRSADRGQTWRRQGLGLSRAVLALAASPTSPDLVVAATPLGVFVSRDKGASWEQVSGALDGAEIHSLGFLPGSPDVLFAATATGLLKSIDRGRVWQRRGSGLPLSDIAGLTLVPDGRTLYASDYAHGGLYRSEDAGDSWRPFPTAGLSSERIWSMAVDPSAPERLLASAATGGLHFRSQASVEGAAGAH
ncbi:MAG: WD40/YVTN/BNR-like repeat-containing protein [Vicinamibacteria bacterium]